MNFKIATILDSKALKPEFIKKRDIRGITPEFLINRFKFRVKSEVYSENGKDYVTLYIARKNGQKPDMYTFQDGKFESRFAQRECSGEKMHISTVANENGFVTKTIMRDKDNQDWMYKVETVIGTVKKAKNTLLGKIGLDSEKVDVRIKRHKILPSADDSIPGHEYMPLWVITLRDKMGKFKAVSTPEMFLAKKIAPDNNFRFVSSSKLGEGFDLSNLINSAFIWNKGDFRN